MNISNLLTASAAVTIAVAGTIYSKTAEPAIVYYISTPNGCPVYSNPGCTTTNTGTPCTVFLDEYGVNCPIKRDSPTTGLPCAISMYRP